MEDSKNKLIQLIKNAPLPTLLDSPEIGARFKHLYKVIHGIKDPARAEAFYTAEKFHFLKLVNDSENLRACTKISLYGVFMDVAVSGLSFDPTMKHLYLVPYNINVGTRNEPRWEKRASLQISGTGELLLRILQGQIKYADNPVLVYDGDEFKYGNKNNSVILEHISTIPRKSDKIIASYLKITRYDDSVDFKVMTMEDIQQLRKFSKDQNSKAWTDGISGMVQAKTIKHAFKNYPKIRVGEFTRLASETVDEELQEDGTHMPGIFDDDFPTDDPQQPLAGQGQPSTSQGGSPTTDDNSSTGQPAATATENQSQQQASQPAGVSYEDENF